MIDVAIYDSKIESAKKIEKLLLKLYRQEIQLFTCESIFALENYVLDTRNGNVDILFVSLSASEKDTISRVGAMQKEFPNIQVTFLAEDITQAVHIFEADPAYFIKKPINEKYLQEAMNRMLSRLYKIRKRVLLFESPKGIFIIPRDEILYIESNRKEITFVLTMSRREKGIGRLDELMEKLGEGFVRCHQSYIVNVDKITCVSTKEITLFNEKRVPISRHRHKEARQAIVDYFGEE